MATVLLSVGAPTAAAEDGILAVPSEVQDQRGIELFGGRLWVSAFANLAFESLNGQPEEVSLDDVGVLARWDALDRLSFFVALELEDTFTWIDGEGVSAFDEAPSVERLHADIALGSGTTLHLGKTLTPFGIWNPIRRAPLTWTVDRPLVTEHAFPFHVTGATLSHKATVGAWNIDSDVYAQPAGELDPIGDEKAADGLVGGRVAFGHALPKGFATAGLQAAWFEDTQSDNQEYAVGFDLDLSIAGQLITSEFIVFDSEIEVDFDGESDDYAMNWGTYLQLVSPIWRGLFGVVRGELVSVEDRHDYKALIVGFAWRAESERWLFKVNYQFTDNAVDDRTDGVGVAVSFLY